MGCKKRYALPHQLTKRKLMRYKTIKCNCGGTIADWKHKDVYTCDRCMQEYPLYKLQYDILVPNRMTGWVFPCEMKEEK